MRVKQHAGGMNVTLDRLEVADFARHHDGLKVECAEAICFHFTREGHLAYFENGPDREGMTEAAMIALSWRAYTDGKRRLAANDKARKRRQGREAAYRMAGLKKVRGALGGIYWE